MGRCTVCGNEYDKSFDVTMQGETSTFDSFECAIHALAKVCAHCGCRIIGHGMEKDGVFYCCAHCAERAGAPEMVDRVETGHGG
jgi:Rieske Fe-S protein